ncbi:MAG: ribbon-helix-helix domain-containing protein [Chloroflexota bacterium]|nr:ribbon-helix-helix domain-containing protein [Chloroflexota bacterium]
MPVTPDRQGWYRFTVRMPEEEYRALERACAKLNESPNTVIREAIARVVPTLDAVGDALPMGPGEYRVTATEVMEALAQVYEQRTIALRAAIVNAPKSEG